MQFGIWTPLPHTIRPEPEMDRAVALLKAGAHGAGGQDEDVSNSPATSFAAPMSSVLTPR